MRERGWTTYPLSDEPDGQSISQQLALIQTEKARRTAAESYAENIAQANAASANEVGPDKEFSNWLAAQPQQTQRQYERDFSGNVSEDQSAAKGSCKGEALEDMKSSVPIAFRATEARAGEIYQDEVTPVFRRTEKLWRSCMMDRGYPNVGNPLAVYRESPSNGSEPSPPGAEEQRLIDQQAVAEHECSVKRMDKPMREAELRAVARLIEEFPQFKAIVEAR